MFLAPVMLGYGLQEGFMTKLYSFPAYYVVIKA